MYDWRKMTPKKREETLQIRKIRGYPWHRPPHFTGHDLDTERYRAFHLSAACYEHCPFIGTSPERIAQCEEQILSELKPHCDEIHAWSVLPNHYHILIELSETASLDDILGAVGQFHGRSSYQWNGQDNARGRRVWYQRTERAIRTERHFWATMNYVHHNPVRHGYVRKWQDWPFSSARRFLESMGRDEVARIWQEFPLLDYGKGWDDPNH